MNLSQVLRLFIVKVQSWKALILVLWFCALCTKYDSNKEVIYKIETKIT